MSLTHWKQYQDDNTLGAWIFEQDKDIIATIKDVKYEDFVGADKKKGKKRICYFKEFEKPMVLNSTNSATISAIYNTPYMEQWVGKKIQLYKDKIRAFGEDRECIRIRKWDPTICSECKKPIKSFGNMSADQVSIYTTAKYKFCLCSDCATELGGKNAT